MDANSLDHKDLPDPARKPSMVEDAYRSLKAAIRDNVFPPGYRGSEQEMALRLGMSRTPVHEAIIRLQEEGMVRVLAKRGVMVCPLSAAGRARNLRSDDRDRGHGCGTDRRAAANRRAEVVRALSEATDRMDQALARDDLAAWAEADDAFHRTLVEQCENSRIRKIAQT